MSLRIGEEVVIKVGNTLLSTKVKLRIACGENNYLLTLEEPQTRTLFWRYESLFTTATKVAKLVNDGPG